MTTAYKRLRREKSIALLCGVGLFIIWLIAFLTSCGDEAAWVSPLGVRVYPGPLEDYFTPGEVDAHARAVISEMMRSGFSEGALLGATAAQAISVYPGPIDGRNGTVLGNGIKVRAFPCVWGTALRHEMTHHIEAWFLGAYDYAHQASWWAHADESLGPCL